VIERLWNRQQNKHGLNFITHVRLKVFENRLPRRIFGPKRHEMMGDWKKKIT
jgi:hypothetical protein